jgi:hypothetical protein
MIFDVWSKALPACMKSVICKDEAGDKKDGVFG